MYNYPRNSSLFGIKIEQHTCSFLETNKTLCRIHIALCKISSMLEHMPQIWHHMHWPSFPLGSKYNINNLPRLYWKFVLDTISYVLWFLWRSCSHTVYNVPVKRLSTLHRKALCRFHFWRKCLSAIETLSSIWYLIFWKHAADAASAWFSFFTFSSAKKLKHFQKLILPTWVLWSNRGF